MKSLILALALVATSALATDKTMLVVPANPGGLPARLAIKLQPHLETLLSEPVYLEFKPGASGRVGAEFLATRQSPKLTLMLGSAQRWTDPGVSQLTDLVPVAFIGVAPGIIVAKPNAPFSSYKEFLVWAKSNKAAYGVPGSSAHPPLFRQIHEKYEAPVTEVFYRAGSNVIADVIGGHIPVGVTAVEGAFSFIESGQLKPLAVFSDTRSRLLPNVLTLQEQGINIPNAHRYYNNLFIWANKSADPKALDAFRSKLLKFLASKEARDFYEAADIQLGTKEPKNAAAILSSIVE